MSGANVTPGNLLNNESTLKGSNYPRCCRRQRAVAVVDCTWGSIRSAHFTPGFNVCRRWRQASYGSPLLRPFGPLRRRRCAARIFDRLCDLDKDTAGRLSAEYALGARVHLNGYRDLLIGEVHHVGDVAGEESAVSPRRAGLCLADDDAETVFRLRSQHRRRDAVQNLAQQRSVEGFSL